MLTGGINRRPRGSLARDERRDRGSDEAADRRRAGRRRPARRSRSRTRSRPRRSSSSPRRLARAGRRRGRRCPRGLAGLGAGRAPASAASCCTRWRARLRERTEDARPDDDRRGRQAAGREPRRARLDGGRLRLLRRDRPRPRRPRDPADRVDPAGDGRQGPARRRRLHRPLELPAAAARLEGRAGARRRATASSASPRS